MSLTDNEERLLYASCLLLLVLGPLIITWLHIAEKINKDK